VQEPETVKGSERMVSKRFFAPGVELTARDQSNAYSEASSIILFRQFESRGAKVLFVADTCHGGGLLARIDPRAEEMSFRQVPTYTLLVDMLNPSRMTRNR